MATQIEVPRAQSKGLADFRLIPRIETYPAVVSFVQTPLGRLALFAAFGAVFNFCFPSRSWVVILTAVFAFITFMPEYRRMVLALTPIAAVVTANAGRPSIIAETFFIIGMGMLLYWCAMRWPKSMLGRRPLIFLLSGFSALIVAACMVAHTSQWDSVLWSMVGIAASYVWFIAYAVTDRTSNPKKDGTLTLASLRPLWGSTNTPFPKGAAYLRRIEAKTPEQLAVTQLKGLKLLVWALMLSVFQIGWFRFFHGYLKIPMPDQALAMSVRGTPVAWHLCWESQILAYFELILSFSIMGHKIIGCCRMAGYNALRNTYRPLSATTVIDFFNRFYYYFKELLVDFFYYPAFFRYFKGHRKLRTIFATFAAVVFGDSFYHITRDYQFLRDRDLWGGIASYQVLIVYNTALAIGLSVSQLRKRKSRPAGFLIGRLLPATGVAFFYILVIVFGSEARTFTLPQTFRYFASLFFIHY